MATRILVADESQNVLRSVKVILGQEGYEVVGVADGSELDAALERMRPHVVLVDAEFPPTDGYMACRAIKNDDATSHMSVLLMVGTFVQLDRSALEASQAEGFITKPFDPLALKARIREVVKELEDTHRIKLSEVEEAREEPSQEILAEVEALSDVPELEADDLGDLADQDATFPEDAGSSPPSEVEAVEGEAPEGAEEPAEPAEPAESEDQQAEETEPEAGEESRASDEPEAPAQPAPRLMAFVQKLKSQPSPPQEESLSDEERRIIEDNEAMLREVAPRERAQSEESDLRTLVEDEDEKPAEVARSDEAWGSISSEEPAEEPQPAVAPPVQSPEPEGPLATPPLADAVEAVAELTPADEVSSVPPEPEPEDVTLGDETGEQSVFELDEPALVGRELGHQEVSGAHFDADASAPAESTSEPAVQEAEATPVVPEAEVAGETDSSTSAIAALGAEASKAAEAASLEVDAATIDRIVAEVVKRISDEVVREIAWEVVPELAELYVQKKLKEQ